MQMNASGGPAYGIGQPVRRKEDFRLLTGKGCFGDDIALPELAHAVVVRSPHAHARIRRGRTRRRHWPRPACSRC